MLRNFFNCILRRQDCRDTLAHKIAQLKGELAAVMHLMDHYQAKAFDPYRVPECWKHAEKIQMLHDLKEEYSALTKKLIALQNRDTTQRDKETTA